MNANSLVNLATNWPKCLLQNINVMQMGTGLEQDIPQDAIVSFYLKDNLNITFAVIVRPLSEVCVSFEQILDLKGRLGIYVQLSFEKDLLLRNH